MVKISEDSGTYQLEVKFIDLLMTNNCASTYQIHFWWSSTKAWGSKRIRYPCSPRLKLCRLVIGKDRICFIRILADMKVFGLWGEYDRKFET